MFYDDLDGEAVVWTAPSGSGRVALLGFDWFEQPTPTDWETVLDNAIASIQGSLQATTIPTLDQWGLIALLGLLAGAGLLLAGRTRV